MWLNSTQITDTGCAALAAAIRSGALPALQDLILYNTPGSAASQAAVFEALVSRRRGLRFSSFSDHFWEDFSYKPWLGLGVSLTLSLALEYMLYPETLVTYPLTSS